MYLTAIKALKITIHIFQTAKITFLQIKKAPTKISSKYLDYANIFSVNLAIELLEHYDINDDAIKLVNNK